MAIPSQRCAAVQKLIQPGWICTRRLPRSGKPIEKLANNFNRTGSLHLYLGNYKFTKELY